MKKGFLSTVTLATASDIVHVFNTDVRYGITYWYTNTAGGGKLREMQYVWAFFNTMCAMCGVWVYLLWNEAVVGVHRDRRVFRQKVIALPFIKLEHAFSFHSHATKYFYPNTRLCIKERIENSSRVKLSKYFTILIE